MWGISFPEPYMSLYNASALAIKSVDSQLAVGGPATAQVSIIHRLQRFDPLPFLSQIYSFSPHWLFPNQSGPIYKRIRRRRGQGKPPL
jgi:hypothetical protein